ncbi:MAG: hypothetical protein JWL71_4082 [Acidobacteria bacterium]|nr:hypothetical protein [Acidobacteriota bacterium]
MDRRVYGACLFSLSLGLLFVFVWAPHPWGAEGFDHYHDIALELARGRPFPTMEVPWGYAYFLAAFYHLFGDHTWIPLVAQVGLNALMPLLVYALARTWLDHRTSVWAAVLTGVFSFNTVYASTQSSDAVCTVLFLAALVAFAQARRRESFAWFALTGLLAGIAPQLRPNLVLIPVALAGYAVLERRRVTRLAGAMVLVACAAAALAPWTIRNYMLTRTLLPTSVHGGVQLWYGTLQVGPYLNGRTYNPASVFEAPVFPYTSLDAVPLVVQAQGKACANAQPTAATITYWYDSGAPREIAARQAGDGQFIADIPPPGRDAALYFYLTAAWPAGHDPERQTTPSRAASAPFVYFVTQNHLGDADARGDLLDIFDLVRLARRDAWHEPLPFADGLARAGIHDAAAAAAILARPVTADDPAPVLEGSTHTDAEAVIAFRDGSRITVPRVWSGRLTDISIVGPMAESVMTAPVPLTWLSDGDRTTPAERCAELESVRVNDVFYRREPHLMRRYAALALDNIRRTPVAFALASAYRFVRLFVVVGTADRSTAQQFSSSRTVYLVATAASLAYLILFIAGVWRAWRDRDAFWLPLLLILYVPATIAPVLTNMRYTVTVQPLVFMFVAKALSAKRMAAAAHSQPRFQ